MNENTLSANLERIKDAVDDIRTAVDMEDNPIEEVADAVEVLADNEYNAYKVGTLTEMGAISTSKLKTGDICTVMDNDYSYIPYRANVLTRVLTFPKTFTTSEEPEEFSDVNFSLYSNGNVFTAGGNVSLTKGGGCGCGSGSGGSSLCLGFDLIFNSTDPSRPCESFIMYIGYEFDEDNDQWVRTSDLENNRPETLGLIGEDTLVFPVECGFNRTGGGSLPSIILDCVQLHRPNLTNPKQTGISSTLARSFMCDGIFLPFEITTTGNANKGFHFKTAMNGEGVYSGALSGTRNTTYNYRALIDGNRYNLKVDIRYVPDSSSSNHYTLNQIVIQDKNTGNYIYNYTNYNTLYPNYDFYIYFLGEPEFFIDTQDGTATLFQELFQPVALQKPRTYEYSTEKGNIWVRTEQ